MIGEIIFGVVIAAVAISFIVLFTTKGWPEEQTRVLDKADDEPDVPVVEDEITGAKPAESVPVDKPTVRKTSKSKRYAKVRVQ